MTVFLGVDPGINGAIAAYWPETRFFTVTDFPLIATKAAGRKTVRNEIDEQALRSWFNVVLNKPEDAVGFVEQVGAMPKQGVSSTFRFGMAYGMIRGMLAVQKIPYTLVRPQEWKKEFSLGRDKDEARLIVSRMFPHLSSFFERKNDANRAEAVLIAVYGSKRA